jgi:hypothetical protein
VYCQVVWGLWGFADERPKFVRTAGLTEASTFEEIQAARDRMVDQYAEEPKQQAAVEAAYDAILMERLRLRQEGKIKVPDRIRFAENAPEPSSPVKSTPSLPRPDWLNSLVDTPSRDDILWPAVVYGGLLVLGFARPVAGAGGGHWGGHLLSQPQRKQILAFGAAHHRWLAVGLALGLTVGQLLIPQGRSLPGPAPTRSRRR